MIIIDEQKIFDVITERKPISVAINGPDGILPKIQETAQHIMEKFDIPAFVLGDTTWGTCDLNSNGAKVLGAEILFNVGHTNKLDTFENNVVMIDAFDKIAVANDISPAVVAGGIKIALLTTVFGLVVAIILQIFYNYIVSKIDSIVNNMEDASISLIDLLVKNK